jgi:hypothetical protein
MSEPANKLTPTDPADLAAHSGSDTGAASASAGGWSSTWSAPAFVLMKLLPEIAGAALGRGCEG